MRGEVHLIEESFKSELFSLREREAEARLNAAQRDKEVKDLRERLKEKLSESTRLKQEHLSREYEKESAIRLLLE